MIMDKQMRHAIYCSALTDMENDLNVNDLGHVHGGGLCWYLGGKRNNVDIDAKTYPEIFKHMPKIWDNDDFWFPRNYEGYLKRIEILKQAVKETE